MHLALHCSHEALPYFSLQIPRFESLEPLGSMNEQYGGTERVEQAKESMRYNAAPSNQKSIN